MELHAERVGVVCQLDLEGHRVPFALTAMAGEVPFNGPGPVRVLDLQRGFVEAPPTKGYVLERLLLAPRKRPGVEHALDGTRVARQFRQRDRRPPVKVGKSGTAFRNGQAVNGAGHLQGPGPAVLVKGNARSGRAHLAALMCMARNG